MTNHVITDPYVIPILRCQNFVVDIICYLWQVTVYENLDALDYTDVFACYLSVMSKSSHGHPFGREDEVSCEQLFKFFCNNLHLGQWELARACIPQLHKQKSALHGNVENVLDDVIGNPYGYRWMICQRNDCLTVSSRGPHPISRGFWTERPPDGRWRGPDDVTSRFSTH